MDPDPPPPPPPRSGRKGRFAPKAPPARRAPTVVPDNTVKEVEDDEAAQRNLRRIINKHLNRGERKEENKNTTEVAFTLEVESNTIRTFGKGKEKIEGTSGADESNDSVEDMQVLDTHGSTARTGVGENSPGLTDDAPTGKKKGEYKELWEGLPSDYPVELPLRMPDTGNPEHLDAAEFIDAPVYDENSVSSASELGLLGQGDDSSKLMFLQLPTNLPFGSSCPSRVSKGKEIAGSSTNHKPGSLEECPAGQMGKLLVYKSGAVKWKLGDILYDVSPGVECKFSQNLMAMDTTNELCCDLGELKTRAVITPDIDSLLDNVDRTTDLGKP